MTEQNFRVIPVNETFNGKTYRDWISQWCNWFFMENSDQYNADPWNDVKFLRSFPSARRIAEMAPGERITYEGSPMSLNTPNVMVGEEKIVMYDDQALFFPAMLAIWINKSNRTFAFMERWVKTQNSNSDDPPPIHQITLDQLPIFSGEEIKNHKLDTGSTFRINIPDVEYGLSLKDFVADPFPPGWYEAYCQGYFFMLAGLPARERPYQIYSRARGAPYEAGDYYASFCYEVQVIPRAFRPLPPKSGIFPERIFASFKNEINNSLQDNDDKTIANILTETINNSKKVDECYLKTRDKGMLDTIQMLIFGRLNTMLLASSGSNKRGSSENLRQIVRDLEKDLLQGITQEKIDDSKKQHFAQICEMLEDLKKSDKIFLTKDVEDTIDKMIARIGSMAK